MELLALKDSKKSGFIFGALFIIITTIAAFCFPDILKAYFNLINEGASQATLDNSKYITDNITSSNDIIGYTFYIAGALKYLLALFFISFFLKSYRLNILKQSIADGFKKLDFIKGKVLILASIFAALTVVTLVIALIAGPFVNPNFFAELSFSSAGLTMFSYFVEQLTFFSIVMLVAMIIKKSNLVIAAILMYCFCGVYLISSYLGDFMTLLPLNTNFFVNAFPIKKYFLEISQNDPVVWIGIGVSILYIFISSWMANYVLNRQNLSVKVS